MLEQEENRKALRVIAVSFVWIAFTLIFFACNAMGDRELPFLVAPVFLGSVVAVVWKR
jgi:hypothetical protein